MAAAGRARLRRAKYPIPAIGRYSRDVRLGGAAIVATLLAVAAPAFSGRAAVTADCPVTQPNGYTPAGAVPNPENHGAGPLMAALWWTRSAIDSSSARPDGSVALKLPWWRGVPGDLSITGRRLDAPAPPLVASAAADGYPQTGFLPSGLLFATRGCWEVTGTLGATAVTFVLRIDVGREARGLPTATLLTPRMRGRSAYVRWRAADALAFDVAVRRTGHEWRVIRNRQVSKQLTFTPTVPGRYFVRVRAHDSFGSGKWSPARAFVVR